MARPRQKRRGAGEGNISKRKDGTWQGSVLLGYDPETGNPKRKYFYGKTRKEVQRKVGELTIIPERHLPGTDQDNSCRMVHHLA